MEQMLKNMNLEFFGKGKHKISPDRLFELEDVLQLDVRSKEEASSISITMECHPNIECRNIPVDEIPDRINEIPREKTIAVFCPANVRSTMTYVYLLCKGSPFVVVLDGGYSALTDSILPGKIVKSIVHSQLEGTSG
jgi:rhodanese-related sulfurtransferase